MNDSLVNEALESMNDEGNALLDNSDCDLMYSRNKESGTILVVARGDWAVEIGKAIQGSMQ